MRSLIYPGCFYVFENKYTKKVSFDDKIFMYLEDADLTRRFLVSHYGLLPCCTCLSSSKLTHKELKFKWITVQVLLLFISISGVGLKVFIKWKYYVTGQWF
jgi:GT2 family glycosyltransferase